MFVGGCRDCGDITGGGCRGCGEWTRGRLRQTWQCGGRVVRDATARAGVRPRTEEYAAARRAGWVGALLG